MTDGGDGRGDRGGRDDGTLLPWWPWPDTGDGEPGAGAARDERRSPELSEDLLAGFWAPPADTGGAAADGASGTGAEAGAEASPAAAAVAAGAPAAATGRAWPLAAGAVAPASSAAPAPATAPRVWPLAPTAAAGDGADTHRASSPELTTAADEEDAHGAWAPEAGHPRSLRPDSAAANGAPPAHGRGRSRHRGPLRVRARRIAIAAGALVVAAGVVAAATTSAPVDPVDPSGVHMPTSDGGGWQRVFSEDFATGTPKGGFERTYADRFSVYHGFADTAGTGRYTASALTAHDGMLDMRMRTTKGGTPLAGGIVPLVDGQWGGQTAGRYSIRMKSDEVDGYGVAVLLWSDQNVWADGEIDFPEGALGAPAWLNVHCLVDPAEKCIHHETQASLADWHTYTIEWTPVRMSFLVDGVVVGSTTKDIPTAKMHFVVQTGSLQGVPPRDAEGSLLIDWMTIDVPAPGREPAATQPGPGAVGD